MGASRRCGEIAEGSSDRVAATVAKMRVTSRDEKPAVSSRRNNPAADASNMMSPTRSTSRTLGMSLPMKATASPRGNDSSDGMTRQRIVKTVPVSMVSEIRFIQCIVLKGIS